jgi:hypothetical protein
VTETTVLASHAGLAVHAFGIGPTRATPSTVIDESGTAEERSM